MKKFFALLLALMLMTASSALADRYYDEYSTLPQDSQQKAQEAAAAFLPGASLDHFQLDYDDRRLEWDVFFSLTDMLGYVEIDAKTYEVLRTVEYKNPPVGAMNAAQAIEALKAAKGALTIVDLDLERDDGRLVYEGEAELDGRFYDFEMTVNGQIIEWERD